jgi:hypothetical protein
LRPDDLFPHDQDHYGGLAANDAHLIAEPGLSFLHVLMCSNNDGGARFSAAKPA